MNNKNELCNSSFKELAGMARLRAEKSDELGKEIRGRIESLERIRSSMKAPSL